MTLRIKTANGETIEHIPPHANFRLPLIRDFTDAVLTGREPRVGDKTGSAIAGIEDETYSSRSVLS